MQKTYKQKARIIKIEKLKNSTNGNPRYELILDTLDDNQNIKVWTESNAGFAYTITNQMLNKVFNCELVEKRNKLYIIGVKTI